MRQDGQNYVNQILIWRPNPTIRYIGENENIKFSPTCTLCKYFTVSEFDISSGIYEQHFYPNKGGSRDGCMIFVNSMCPIMYSLVLVKHSAKYRGLG